MTGWANFGQSVAIIAGVGAVLWALARLADAATEWAKGWRWRAEEARPKAAHAKSNEEHFRVCWEMETKRADREAREAVLMTQAYSRADHALAEMTAKRDAAVAQARRWKALAMRAKGR